MIMHAEPIEPTIRFADLECLDRPLRLEYQFVGVNNSDYPVIVFLHEGLGSISLWNDFPHRFCVEHGLTGLVFSRYGYGNSTPRPDQERWPVTYMHTQAFDVLPALLTSLGITRPWLFGHSDGASIALLHASRFSDQLSGIVTVAPHIFVEDITISSIRAARDAYLNNGLRKRLARYHANVDSAFWGWNDAWLNPDFRAWNIENELSNITCPVLVVQGENDEYGTLKQIIGIQNKIPLAQLEVIPNCGHSPHRDQPVKLGRAAVCAIKGSSMPIID